MLEINENSCITQLGNLTPIFQGMFICHFSNIRDLLNCSVLEMIKKPGINLFRVACLKKSLNAYGFHLIDENLIDYSDFLAEDRKELVMECNRIVKRRRYLLGKKSLAMEEEKEIIELTFQINEILAKIRVLRISNSEEELRRIHSLIRENL